MQGDCGQNARCSCVTHHSILYQMTTFWWLSIMHNQSNSIWKTSTPIKTLWQVISWCLLSQNMWSRQRNCDSHIYNLQNDFSHARTAYGSAIFIKGNHDFNAKSLNSSTVELTLLQITTPKHVNILCVYNRPKESFNKVERALQSVLISLDLTVDTIIMGDFNTPELTYRRMCSFMQGLGFQQIISEPTTNNKTMIDLIFINFNNIKNSGVLESYYSHHKAVWIAT